MGKEATLMFRHLPRKYSARDLLPILAQHVTAAAFDFVYVPWDKNSNFNMGYAFVNFVDCPTARMIEATMNGSIWPNDSRKREVKILPARVQGLAANLRRYIDSVAKLDLSNCPLVFRRGEEILLQAAAQEFLQMQLVMPQWSIGQSCCVHSGQQPAPAHGAVSPPPACLSAVDFP